MNAKTESAVLESAAHVSTEALKMGTPVALRTGHINHAASIYSAFVVDADKQGLTQLETLKEIAQTAKLSCVEFSAQCKEAQKIADSVDKLAGFKKAEGAKGQDSYGPKRRLLNQRLSEAKRLFGVFKLSPETLDEKGYWPALADAREYLENKGITWDGQPALNAEEKQEKRAGQIRTAARAQAMDTHPQHKGEEDEVYLLRVRGLMAQAVENAETEEFNKGVKSLYDSLTKKHTTEMLYSVMTMMLESMTTDELESTQQWIAEEIVVRVVNQA